MDRLATYRAKRHFDQTTEPSGEKAPKSGGGLYVIHEHAATRLHYDLRLEHDGVLLSWAVTKGPSLDPAEKRLAVHVEDHPLDYGSFEGTIPEGNYGAGAVVLWDRGRWVPDGDPRKGLKKGHLKFRLEGEKLRGDWHLVRLKGRPREKRDNWLLIKSKDDEAATGRKAEITKIATQSVKTGRTLDEVAAGKAPPKKKKAKRGAKEPPPKGDPPDEAPARREPPERRRPKEEPPKPETPKKARASSARGRGKAAAFVPPCLARLDKTPRGKAWLHEIKFDGYRVQAVLVNGRAKLITRTGLDWTDHFGPEIPRAVEALPCRSAVIDGEVVALSEGGIADFSALQADLSERRSDRLVLYVFDLLHLDGRDLTPLTLLERKEALETLFGGENAVDEGPVRYSRHFTEDGEVMLAHACRLGLEGVVSKRRDAPYRSGRTGDWIKSKCTQRQEFAIAGYVPSTVARNAVGSIVVGYYEGGEFKHAGRVGTGFTEKSAKEVKRRLDALKADRSPFKTRRPDDREVKWVRPELVAEVEFRAWTAGGSLRHASFMGLREDKPASEIVREGDPAKTAKTETKATRTTVVKISHPDRVLWPDCGVTKQGLLDHYAAVWDWIAPHVRDRPLSLLRAPDGVGGQQGTFFQKHRSPGMHAAIGEVKDPKDGKGLIRISDFDGLAALVQFGVVEIHIWGSTAAKIEQPDQIVIDLDPDKGVDWGAIVEGAREVKRRLEKLRLVPFLKTTGGKGLHIVAPLKPKAEWPEVKRFCQEVAAGLARDFPDRYTANMAKKVRTGRIFVDYLRNGRGATAIAPYSTRARAGATVAVPIEWEELDLGVRPDQFGVDNLMNRLDHQKKDPWAGFRAAAKPLPKI